MKPYHPNNIKLTGRPYWRLAALAWAGKLLGIQFQVDGLPFGSVAPKRKTAANGDYGFTAL